MSTKVMTKKMAATLIAEKLTKQTGKEMTAQKAIREACMADPRANFHAAADSIG